MTWKAYENLDTSPETATEEEEELLRKKYGVSSSQVRVQLLDDGRNLLGNINKGGIVSKFERQHS